MRFTLIDRVTELTPGAKITTAKSLSLAEEYLADHFPLFPVMPGVLMLEAMTQTAAWLVRASEDFAHSVVVLGEAKNVKYADFVQPGQVLTITAEIVKQDARTVDVKAQGTVGGKSAVSGRLLLERFNLADTRPELADTDRVVIHKMRELWSLLYRPATAVAAS